MSAGGQDDDRSGPPAQEVAAGMLDEARRAALGAGEDADADASASAGEPEAGTIADTGQPAGTADAEAAGVMDTEAEGRP